MLDPRLIVSAHTHHGCYRIHDNGVPEYTVASYNWRNKNMPTFLLVGNIVTYNAVVFSDFVVIFTAKHI